MRILGKGCYLLIMLLLTACEQRQELAPVVELNWRAANQHSNQHRVARGETLYAIAFRYEKDYRQLAQINHLESPYTLRVGQTIYLNPSNQSPAEPLPLAHPSPATRPTRFATPSAPPLLACKWWWPVNGKVKTHFSPKDGCKGVNIAGVKGAQVHAAADGVVAYAGSGLTGYGNLIIIKHKNQYLTAYGNNLHNYVREGQRVRAGQPIAEIGIIDRRYWGVHFEIRRAGIPVNPLNYLQKG